MEEKGKCNRKRRERALKMRAEISEKPKASDDSCEEGIPLVRSKPPRPRKKNKDPLFDEEVVDGFAIQSFRSYEDLERCVRAADRAGSKLLDPCPDKHKSDVNKRKILVPKRNNNNNKNTSSHKYSSGEGGYICDSEGDGDKVSDGDDLFIAQKKSDGRCDTPVTKSDATTLPSVDANSHQTLYGIITTCSVDLPKLSDPKRMVDLKPVPSDLKPLIDTKPFVDHKPLYPEQKVSGIDHKPYFNACSTTSPFLPHGPSVTTSTATTTVAQLTVPTSFNHVTTSANSQLSNGNHSAFSNKYSVVSLVSNSIDKPQSATPLKPVLTYPASKSPVSFASPKVSKSPHASGATPQSSASFPIPHKISSYSHIKTEPDVNSKIVKPHTKTHPSYNSLYHPTVSYSSPSHQKSRQPSPLLVKLEPGTSRATPPTPNFVAPARQSPAAPTRHSPAARHSPARHSPRAQEIHPGLYNYPPAGASVSAAHNSSKPWTSTSTAPSRLSSLSRSLGAGGFSLSSPVSAPLPPSGMFAPPLPNPQPLSGPSIPPPPNPSSDPLAQADILRRELDSRFLATQDRTIGLPGPTLGALGTVPTLLRTDVHHHQHQHTHVHQHLLPQMAPPPPPPPIAPQPPSGLFSHSSATPSLFKEVNKVGIDNSPMYRQRNSLGSSYAPGLSPLVGPPTSTSFTPPQLSTSSSKKTGKWNIMHVRIAWEILYDQQKLAADKAKLGNDSIRPSGPHNSAIYSGLPRPDHLGSMVTPPRMDSSFLGSHITPSVPGLTGFRYTGSNSSPSFPHPGSAPTGMPGPPPGSMFSRDPTGALQNLSNPSHDAWSIRTPTAYSSGANWPPKPTDASYFERERREQEERQRREREEKERREKEERERREREERERREREEKEKREREEKERERERERRAEQEKERLSRLEASYERPNFRREDRSPIRVDGKEPPRPKSDSKDEVTIVGSKEAPTRYPHIPHLPPPGLPTTSTSFLSSHPLPSSSTSPLDRSRLFGPWPSPAPPPWDPLRDTSYRIAQEQYSAQVRAHDLALRDSMLSGRDPFRESLERAREEQLLRTNPLGPMIFNERIREQQVARELIEREQRNYVAAAAGIPSALYSQSLLPHAPTSAPSMLPPSMKTSLGYGHHLPHPLHPPFGALYPPSALGSVPGHPPLGAPGLPPPLISHSLRPPGSSMARPPDKKEPR